MAILVDANHLFFRNFWMNVKDIVTHETDQNGKAVPTDEINEGYLVHLVYQNMLSFAKKFGASEKNKVYICLDSKPSWRHSYYVENSKKFPEYATETYKGDRSKNENIPWEKIFVALDEAYVALNLYTDFIVVKEERAEADDVIAVLAREISSTGEEVYICSSDKDFVQLQSDKVHIYDPLKKIIIPPCDVDTFMKLHILVAGDDNIKAVKPRCGEGTAKKMLKELDTILKTDPEVRARYQFNQTLIDFNFIPEDIKSKIINSYHQIPQQNFQPSQLLVFFSKKNMKQMVGRIQEFKLTGKVAVQPLLKAVQVSPVQKHAENSIESFFA